MSLQFPLSSAQLAVIPLSLFWPHAWHGKVNVTNSSIKNEPCHAMHTNACEATHLVMWRVRWVMWLPGVRPAGTP